MQEHIQLFLVCYIICQFSHAYSSSRSTLDLKSLISVLLLNWPFFQIRSRLLYTACAFPSLARTSSSVLPDPRISLISCLSTWAFSLHFYYTVLIIFLQFFFSYFLVRNLKIPLSPLLKHPVTRAQRQSLQNSLRLSPWQHNPRPH